MKYSKKDRVISIAILLFFIVFIFISALAAPTESIEEKSVNEQVGIQSTTGTSIDAIEEEEDTPGATAGVINDIKVNTNEKVIIEEEVVEEVAQEEINYDFNKSGWTSTRVNVREMPNTNSTILEVYKLNTEISYADYDDNWVVIQYNDGFAYLSKQYISDEKIIIERKEKSNNTKSNESSSDYSYSGSGHLTKKAGVYYGPSGKETYYNLPMGGVIKYMKQEGYDYEYWVRDDGCKMYGDYIMIAADLSIRPKGTLVETSLGTGIVCDTGTFVYSGDSTWIDIAVAW